MKTLILNVVSAGALSTAALTACAAPPPEKPVTPPCAEDVTTIAWNEKTPCTPVPPQRLDVLFDLVLQTSPEAVVACGAVGGHPTSSLPLDPAWTLRCRTVTVSLYLP